MFIVSYGFKRQLQHNVRKQRWVPNRNLNYLPSGLPLSDHASLADIMLLFCRRLPRNVRSLERPFSAIVLHIRSFVSPHPHCRCLRSWPRVLDILERLRMTLLYCRATLPYFETRIVLKEIRRSTSFTLQSLFSSVKRLRSSRKSERHPERLCHARFRFHM